MSRKPVTIDDCIDLLESIEYMLRGMTLDPSIPEHAKESMRSKIMQIDAVGDRYLRGPKP